MKIYILSAIILITGVVLLAGCTQQAEVMDNPQPVTKEPVVVKESELVTAKADLEKSVNEKNDKAITVYKSPTCGCCSEWEAHLKKAGFTVTSKPTDQMTEVRRELGIPSKMQSCHTGIINGYVIEGHVPADDIKKLLKEKPAEIVGLAAPGMPQKSPGMQPEGKKPEGYDVLSFDKQGNSKVFTSY